MEHYRIKTGEDIFEMVLREAVIEATYREAKEYSAAVAASPDKAELPLSRRAKQTRRLCLSTDRKTWFRKKILPWIKRIA